MKFDATLRAAIYKPWKDQYLDYSKLKQLLRDKESEAGIVGDWTEHEEGLFVNELVNVQLEKVATFQRKISGQLQDRLAKVETTLEKVARSINGESAVEDDETEGLSKQNKAEDEANDKSSVGATLKIQDTQSVLKDAGKQLDDITNEVKELEKYCRLNYTGFLKAAKKHDRIRGAKYKVRTLLQIRLAELPFNAEDYSPLLYRVSVMLSFVRQHTLGSERGSQSVTAEPTTGEVSYATKKFWVHKDNLLEVKSYILRRLPVLMYNTQANRVADGVQPDPTLTSIYFDSPDLELYTNKVDKVPNATSFRVRWFGSLEGQPEIHIEKKTVMDNELGEETRLTLKPKHVQSFLAGTYKKEKEIQRLREQKTGNRASNEAAADRLEKAVSEIQSLISSKRLQPVVRATYSRSAFQIPGDDRIRISIDEDLALIREDALDGERPCRTNPEAWHRDDIDSQHLSYPFSSIRKGEIIRFPYAILEIKTSSHISHRAHDWIADLTSSHLVTEAPRFSKFVHGVATLLEDYANVFPFWLAELEKDIRQHPEKAFEQEQQRRAKLAEDEFAVGSLLKSTQSPKTASAKLLGISHGHESKSLSARRLSPVGAGSGTSPEKLDMDPAQSDERQHPSIDATLQEPDKKQQTRTTRARTFFSSLLPSLSTSKYARKHRIPHPPHRNVPDAPLPPGLSPPKSWLKDEGPPKVEPKVWLANQRTFVKWEHNAVLLASLGLAMLNVTPGNVNGFGAGKVDEPEAGRSSRGVNWPELATAISYTLLALGLALWALRMYEKRGLMIRRRDPGHFDDRLGPVVASVTLGMLLLVDLGVSVRRNGWDGRGGHERADTALPVLGLAHDGL